MDSFGRWALCVTIAAAAGTFFVALSPRGSATKTMRTVTGVFIVASICAPLAEIDIEKISVPVFAQTDAEQTVVAETDDLIFSACRNAAESEIMCAATQCGITVDSVALDAYCDDNNCIIIQEIYVNIQEIDAEIHENFLSAVEEKLGVPVTLIAE